RRPRGRYLREIWIRIQNPGACCGSYAAEPPVATKPGMRAGFLAGLLLLAQRVLMPSNQQFGQWVKEHGLDAGLASRPATRSDAMWLSERYDILQSLQDVTFHHPSDIRKQCLDAGHAWAGACNEQYDIVGKADNVAAERRVQLAYAHCQF